MPQYDSAVYSSNQIYKYSKFSQKSSVHYRNFDQKVRKEILPLRKQEVTWHSKLKKKHI